MGRALFTLVLVELLATALPARAQEPDAGVTTHVRVVRPPEGSLRRGRFAAPSWAVGLGGGALVLSAAGLLVYRASRRR